MIRRNLRILRYAALVAMADLRSMHTWRTWAFAWLLRLLCQVSMFALIGRVVGTGHTAFLLVGNSVFVAVTSVMLACATTAAERMAGTVPLLVAAPGQVFTVFLGRSVQWLLDGMVCSTISLFALAPAFGVRLPMPAALLAVPAIAATAVTVYCFALALGGLALRVVHLRSLVGNLGALSLMVLTGAQVPVGFWPAPLRGLAEVLPVTHGLRAVRGLLAGGPVAAAAGEVLVEAAVGGLWLVVGFAVFRWFAEGGRRDGSIGFDG
ncbi:ABC transporter permease [Kitasatospora viridis]|uniref:Nodulation factor export ABC transporter transmembrane subunit NodJ n=1 Tax=Kitasatospora viridis TaxID=281105 RepID=A0A561UHU5_9ACTN|nr:ABC transporter permease [Kitasatospora viridis]TWF98932.1 nodulation factor export ABC transporter transmembrane subunit NodJ [Kitasatospora viridis]